LDAYSQLGKALPMLSQYEELFKKCPGVTIILALIYKEIMSFHLAALKL
jgi:hypothetical protein